MPIRKVTLPVMQPVIRSVFDVDTLRQNKPPTPPGPLDRLIPTDPNGFTTPYTNTNQVVHFRMAYINGAASQPVISVTVDGTPATLIGHDFSAAVGAAGAIAFYVTGLAPGLHTIGITVSAGTLTKAALRVGELVSQTSIGVVATSIQTNPSYYIEVDAATTSTPGQVGTIACFSNLAAAPIYASYPDTEQWSGGQAGQAFRFATGASPSGESTPGLFVFYSASGALYGAAGLVYQINGAVLP